MGVVHHANYFKYLEIGRTDLLRASGGSYRQMEEDGILVVVASIECRYLAPARYDDAIVVHTTIVKITAAKIVHRYEIRRDEKLLFTADITLACIDRSGQLQMVPEQLRD